MKTLLVNSMDRITTLLCSAGPFRFVGTWWWRKRLASVHSMLEIEQYQRRR